MSQIPDQQNGTPRVESLAIRLDTWFTFCMNERYWRSRSDGWWDMLENIEELSIIIRRTCLEIYQYGVYPKGDGKSLGLPHP